MRPLLSRAQMLAWEEHFIEAGVAASLLMENAGRGAAHIIGLKGKPRTQPSAKPTMLRGSCVRCADEKALSQFRVLLLIGPGKNGSDGLVVARHLLCRGAEITCVEVLESSRPVSASRAGAQSAYEAVGGELLRVDSESSLSKAWQDWARPHAGDAQVQPVVVDALFGTGLNRPLEGLFRQVAELINRSSAAVVALDLPSGLCADSGSTFGSVAIKAEQTITFGHLKKGLLTTQGLEFGARITLSHIGVPAALQPDAVDVKSFLLEHSDLKAWLPERSAIAHKGTLPHVAIWGSAQQYAGAARLSGLGALRAGGGLTTLLTTAAHSTHYQQSALELITRQVKLDGDLAGVLRSFDAFVFGPGLGRDAEAEEQYRVIRDSFLPAEAAEHEAKPLVVLDADALYFLALEPRPLCLSQAVLTPHPKEAARLLGSSVKEVEADRFAAVLAIARRYQAVTLLKGPRTLLSDGENIWALPWGSAALATPGSGDVLSGVIASVWAAKKSQSSVQFAPAAAGEHARKASESARQLAFESVAVAASFHALAGEQWSEQNAEFGLTASDLAAMIPQVYRQLAQS